MPVQTPRGYATKQGILEVATAIASVEGLDGLTLGRLATELAMSKSGLFAHFGSKEELQLAAIEHARQMYVDQVILPGLAHSSGIATLYGLCDRYVALMERRVFPGGCFFAAAMAEFDARPGVVRGLHPAKCGTTEERCPERRLLRAVWRWSCCVRH